MDSKNEKIAVICKKCGYEKISAALHDKNICASCRDEKNFEHKKEL